MHSGEQKRAFGFFDVKRAPHLSQVNSLPSVNSTSVSWKSCSTSCINSEPFEDASEDSAETWVSAEVLGKGSSETRPSTEMLKESS